jgi:hypothetical protein
MTLGCGAAAGNITSDNVGPQHLYNIKRLAYAVRTPAEAFQTPVGQAVPAAATQHIATDIVDRFLARRGGAAPPPAVLANVPAPVPAPVPAAKPDPAPSCGCGGAAPAPPNPPAPPKPQIVDFVCEEDVRTAIKQSRKIYIGPKTIVTPAARDLALPSGILVLA